jgi:hypothetical protein
MIRYCNTHKCQMSQGRYGLYCPNKVNGYWCKGETQAEQDELRQMHEEAEADYAAHSKVEDSAVVGGTDDLLNLIDGAVARSEQARRRRW